MEENSVVLMSKAATLHNKQFLFEFKENQSGQYLCISNGRVGIEVPTSIISVFLNVFKSCSPEKKFVRLRIAGKIYEFRAGENYWGRFRKVSQVWAIGTQYIVVPVEASEGFETIVMEMYRDLSNLFPPKEEISQGNDNINNVTMQEIPQPNQNIDKDRCKIMSLGGQKFSFTLLESPNRLRITKKNDMNISSIFVPMSALPQFHGFVGHLLEPNHNIDKDLCKMTSLRGQKFSFTLLESTEDLRITERNYMNISSIFVPMSALRQFHGFLGHFLEPSNGSSSSGPSSSAPEQDLAEKIAVSDSTLD